MSDNQENNALPAEIYGKGAADWLARFDADQVVYSVCMGGLGDVYEMGIQRTAIEIVRYLVRNNVDFAEFEDGAIGDQKFEELKSALDGMIHASKIPEMDDLTGAMVGAAHSLAFNIYRKGPADGFGDPEIADRLILIKKSEGVVSGDVGKGPIASAAEPDMTPEDAVPSEVRIEFANDDERTLLALLPSRAGERPHVISMLNDPRPISAITFQDGAEIKAGRNSIDALIPYLDVDNSLWVVVIENGQLQSRFRLHGEIAVEYEVGGE